MAAKKKKTTATKVKKKKWFPIFAPAQFNGASLGETYVSESEDMSNKFITVNLSTITRSMRKQNINIHFKMDRVEDGKGYTTIIGYSLINAAMKRLVRRGRDKVTDSFLAKTKDKKVLRVKPLIITLNKGTKSTQSAVRLEARRIVREHLFTRTVEEAFGDIVDGKLQKLIKEAASKLYPLKTVEIRRAKLEENSKVLVTDKAVESEKVTRRIKDKGNQLEVEKPLVEESEEVDAEESTEDFGDDEDSQDGSEVEEALVEESEESSEDVLDEESSEDNKSETPDIVEKSAPADDAQTKEVKPEVSEKKKE